MIYDAHCHLDLMDNMLEFINEIQNSDMNLFAVGTTPKAYSREIQFCKNARNIHVGLGMHPQLVSSGYDDMQYLNLSLKKAIILVRWDWILVKDIFRPKNYK